MVLEHKFPERPNFQKQPIEGPADQRESLKGKVDVSKASDLQIVKLMNNESFWESLENGEAMKVDFESAKQRFMLDFQRFIKTQDKFMNEFKERVAIFDPRVNVEEAVSRLAEDIFDKEAVKVVRHNSKSEVKWSFGLKLSDEQKTTYIVNRLWNLVAGEKTNLGEEAFGPSYEGMLKKPEIKKTPAVVRVEGEPRIIRKEPVEREKPAPKEQTAKKVDVRFIGKFALELPVGVAIESRKIGPEIPKPNEIFSIDIEGNKGEIWVYEDKLVLKDVAGFAVTEIYRLEKSGRNYKLEKILK